MAKTTAQILMERLEDVAVRVLKLVSALPRVKVAQHVGGQLLRCGTSPGANYEEACAAESRRDFVHKLGIVLKELKETRYWLRITRRVPLLPPARLSPLLDEIEELIAIFARSRDTASKKDKRGEATGAAMPTE